MSKILYENQNKYLNSLKIQTDSLLYEMEKFSEENKIPILDKRSADFLEQLILIQKPNRVLEIGTAIAYSSIRIAKKLPTNAVLETIEKSKNNIKLANHFIKRSGIKSINVLDGDALDIMTTIKMKYDFIFLDADKEDYLNLFSLSLPLLKKNGIIFIDNLLWHGYAASSRIPRSFKRSTQLIKDFNEIFMNSSQLVSTILPIGDGIGIGIKK
jgi:predicted O-methyltransferase YrrM